MMGSVLIERERGLMEGKGLPQMQESEACHGSSKVADKPGTVRRDCVIEVSDFWA